MAVPPGLGLSFFDVQISRSMASTKAVHELLLKRRFALHKGHRAGQPVSQASNRSHKLWHKQGPQSAHHISRAVQHNVAAR